jgi:hypothetical protein
MFFPFHRTGHRPPISARGPVAVALFALLMGLAVACVPSESTRSDEETESQTDRKARTNRFAPDLAAPSEDVRTIQVYAGSDERSLPIIRLNGEETIQLEFDLMERQGRPLSIYFDHADRSWQRDLSPSQYLESFQDDDLLEYDPSIGTEIPYVHYRYEFPNDDIRFRVSGNYVLRVTEQGNPDEVLFERAFFIAEEAGGLELSADGVVISGQRQPSIRPIARYLPPSEIRGNPFGYTACFLRNGRLPEAKCEDRPRLTDAPALRFELPRDRAFAPVAADYFLDLSTLRVGGSIEAVDRSTTPFGVLLEPDFAEFAGSSLGPTLNGQTVIRGAQSMQNPEVSSEYVRTTFAFVPPNERPVRGRLRVAGSFTGMQVDPALDLDFVADRGRYEGQVLLKQGHYEYYYDTTDPALRRTLQQNLPRSTNTYTTFVYYEDVRLNTDRLLITRSFRQ